MTYRADDDRTIPPASTEPRCTECNKPFDPLNPYPLVVQQVLAPPDVGVTWRFCDHACMATWAGRMNVRRN